MSVVGFETATRDVTGFELLHCRCLLDPYGFAPTGFTGHPEKIPLWVAITRPRPKHLGVQTRVESVQGRLVGLDSARIVAQNSFYESRIPAV